VFVELVAVVVDEYDPAIAFFVDTLGFELVEDSPALTNDGRPKRWVVVRPPGAETGILLARRLPMTAQDRASICAGGSREKTCSEKTCKPRLAKRVNGPGLRCRAPWRHGNEQNDGEA
jgi:catechol 2,3-dioxygenase-like lactoylglutathione lyase family enzyme